LKYGSKSIDPFQSHPPSPQNRGSKKREEGKSRTGKAR